ncbi:MAG: hypothetical protein ACRCVX_02325 [Shewanella sp.]
MAQGLGGLARGLIAGTELGLSMRRQEAAEQEQESLKALRAKQEERASAADARAEDIAAIQAEQADYEKGLRPMREQAFKSEQDRLASQERRIAGQEKRLASQESRQQSEFDFRKMQAEREQTDQRLMAMAPIEYQRVAQGGDFSDEFMQASKGTRFDPSFMASKDYRDAAKSAYEYTDTLINKMGSGEKISLKDVNNPTYLNALNQVMAPDIRRGVGETDPNTGRTVTDKRLGMILPSENGKLVFEVEVTLDNGEKYSAPITEGRTSNPDDPVKEIPVEKFIDHIGGYMTSASAYNKQDLQNAVSRYAVRGSNSEISSAEVTKRQYLSRQDSVDKWENDQLAKLDPGMIDEPEYSQKVAIIKKMADDQRNNIDKRYQMKSPTVGNKNAAVDVPKGGGQPMVDVSTWAGEDSRKVAFMKEYEEAAANFGTDTPLSSYSPAELDKLYSEWIADQQAALASSVASQLRNK